jgi:hypothetical protein
MLLIMPSTEMSDQDSHLEELRKTIQAAIELSCSIVSNAESPYSEEFLYQVMKGLTQLHSIRENIK